MLYNNYISIKWNKRKERYPVISEVGRVETMKGPDLAQHKSSECRVPSMTTWQCGQFLLSWALVLSLHAGDNPSQRTTVYKNCPGSLLYLTSMSHSVYKQVMAPSRQHGLTTETSERKRRKHPRSEPQDLLSFHLPICWTPIPIPVSLSPDSTPASNTIGFRESEFFPLKIGFSTKVHALLGVGLFLF